MPPYHTFISPRTTTPDPIALVALVRTAVGDAAAGAGSIGAGQFLVQKTTDFSPADLTATQAALDSAPAFTPQLAAQYDVDGWSIELKALALAIIDALNVIRAALPVPLPPITPAQAIAAIRAKAGTL